MLKLAILCFVTAWILVRAAIRDLKKIKNKHDITDDFIDLQLNQNGYWE